ncbi:hypothetical protein BU15DRAFT_65011 [Melanogaster broomeanus]|nr:hypothetical protein BU15DRAFT_65011 [Melanogaster broomeanus]
MLLQHPVDAAQSLRLPPTVRLSLRERRRVSLTVQTTLNESAVTLHHIQPGKDNVPRRSVWVQTPPSPPAPMTPEDEVDTPDAGSSMYLSEKSFIEEIIPGLFVAFADDDFKTAALRTYENKQFSHVVQVTLGPANEITADRSEETLRFGADTQKLRLSCPTCGNGAGHTVLSSDQLLAARDFLSLAMPYTSHKLSSMSKSHSDVQYINEVEDFDDVWKGDILGLDGIDFVEKVARLL